MSKVTKHPIPLAYKDLLRTRRVIRQLIAAEIAYSWKGAQDLKDRAAITAEVEEARRQYSWLFYDQIRGLA